MFFINESLCSLVMSHGNSSLFLQSSAKRYIEPTDLKWRNQDTVLFLQAFVRVSTLLKASIILTDFHHFSHTYPFPFILFQMLNRLGRNLCLSHISGCIGLQRSISIQRRCVSTLSSPFRIGEHLGNIENKGSPFVLIETSFLTKCRFFVPL